MMIDILLLNNFLISKRRQILIAQVNIELKEKSREIAALHKTEYTKDDAIAALSDKLLNLMEEVENLKNRLSRTSN